MVSRYFKSYRTKGKSNSSQPAELVVILWDNNMKKTTFRQEKATSWLPPVQVTLWWPALLVT